MKVNRHAKIIELINKYHIETQEELAEYLNQEGFKVTQATVSRDIRDLKLTKIPSENGKQRYAALDAMKWNEIVGSIAGDDTIMCAIRSVDDTVKVMDKISKIIL